MSSPRPQRIAIVGGGITGMAAAYHLHRQPGIDTILIEADNRLGGTIRTLREDGFTVEAGPDSFLSAKPQALELINALGLASEVCTPLNERFLLHLNGRLQPLPDGFLSMVPTALGPFLRSPLFTLPGKLRALLEPFVPKRTAPGDESVEAFFSRRFGRELSQNVAAPLFGGIHGGLADRLSMTALLPQFQMMERTYGSITKAILSRKRAPQPPSGSAPATAPRKPAMFSSLRGGMDRLTQTLATQLTGVDIRLQTAVTTITPTQGGGFTLTTANATANTADIAVDGLILAVPATAAARLLAPLQPDAARRLQAVPYASTVVVTIAAPLANIAQPLNATGFIIPEGDPDGMTACTWSSSKWPDRAPPGLALLRCYFGRDGATHTPTLADDALIALAAKELGRMIGLQGSLHRAWVFRWPEAMPQYLLGHLDQIQTIENALAPWPRLRLAGAGWRGVGIPDCIRQGREAAQALLTPDGQA